MSDPVVPRRECFAFWLKLGFISFGGPAGQIALMHDELVTRRRWISERRFLHALNYCMLLPGPEAQQLATYLGWLMHRTWGGIVAGTLFVLPSLLILIALSWLYMAYGHTSLVSGLFYGIKPAVVAIVLHAAWRIGARTLKNGMLWAIAVAAFVAIFALHLPFPAIVAGAAVIGLLGGRLAPHFFAASASHGTSTSGSSPALIGDDTPPPAHTRFERRRLALVLVCGAALWLLPMGLMWLSLGWSHTLTQMGWFFSKAALMTFGGAYAVLPYVYQGAVSHYGWLAPTQMMDGLALGETTPGPLIMIVSFVGFVGGWSEAAQAASGAFLAGPGIVLMALLGACVATWFTFLPSFIFILAGGPLVESTHGELRFTAPLTAITAAVVGVILNLALFFVWHVLWPQGEWARPDLAAMLLAACAALALFRFKANVIWVILGSALAGLLLSLAR